MNTNNVPLLMCSETRFSARWSPRKAPPLPASPALLFTKWTRKPMPVTDHHSRCRGPAERSLLLLVISGGDPVPEICLVWTWVRLTWFNKLENFKKLQQSWGTCSPGSDSRRNQGGRSAVRHLCTRVRTAEEADGFSQDGGIHRWQLWAALQWSCG